MQIVSLLWLTIIISTLNQDFFHPGHVLCLTSSWILVVLVGA